MALGEAILSPPKDCLPGAPGHSTVADQLEELRSESQAPEDQKRAKAVPAFKKLGKSEFQKP